MSGHLETGASSELLSSTYANSVGVRKDKLIMTSITETVRITAECIFCGDTDSTKVPVRDLYRYISNRKLKVQDVFPVQQYCSNTRSIIIAWTKIADLGVSAHVCDGCEEL